MFIHVKLCVSAFFFFNTKTFHCMDLPYSSIERHFDCFHFEAITLINKAAFVLQLLGEHLCLFI